MPAKDAIKCGSGMGHRKCRAGAAMETDCIDCRKGRAAGGLALVAAGVALRCSLHLKEKRRILGLWGSARPRSATELVTICRASKESEPSGSTLAPCSGPCQYVSHGTLLASGSSVSRARSARADWRSHAKAAATGFRRWPPQAGWRVLSPLPSAVVPIHVFAEAQVQGFSPRMKSTHGQFGPHRPPTPRPRRLCFRMRLQPAVMTAGVRAC